MFEQSIGISDSAAAVDMLGEEEKVEAPKPQVETTSPFDRGRFAELLTGKSIVNNEPKKEEPKPAPTSIKLFADEFKTAPVQPVREPEPKMEENPFERFAHKYEAPKQEPVFEKREEPKQDFGISSSRLDVDNDDMLPPFLRRKR